MDLSNHPCFNDKVRHTFGRIHLPIAPRCNIQCRFCNRKYDCVNESRPGVTTGVLSPVQAMIYLDAVIAKKKNISVVGIAGPGDPFANPEETMETLRLVRQKYPDMLLCVATNGLNIAPYIDELAQIEVSHVTITVNAIEPEIAEKIYSWVRFDKRLYHPKEGVKILLERQLEAIARLKAKGVVVKVNSIIIPGINDEHIPAIAEKIAPMNVDILNCIPYYPNEGAAFKDILEPSKELIQTVRQKAAKFLPQMHHCTRCRADAVGLLGEGISDELMQLLKTTANSSPPLSTPSVPITLQKSASLTLPTKELCGNAEEKKFVAVASMEGFLVNQHLGEAYQLRIYGQKTGGVELLETRKLPEPGRGMKRWEIVAQIINDCRALLVSGIGDAPNQVLSQKGIEIFELEGLIEEAVQSLYDGKTLRHLIKRKTAVCGTGCSGGSVGCG